MQCWLTRAAAASKALAAWGAGLVIFPVLWEAVGLLAQSHGYVLFRSEITYRITSYFSEVLYQLHGGKQGRMLFDPVIYLEWYAVREGVLMMVLIAGGLALAAVRRSFSWLMPAAMILVPYALYTFAPFIVPRNLDPTVPFATLLAAAALVAAADRITGRVPRLSLLLAAAAGVSLLAAALSWRLGEERSGFVFAADYLHQHGMSRAVVSNENMLYYLRLSDSRCAAAFLHKDLSLLSTARKAGISFAVADVYDTPAKRFLLHHGHRVARYLALGTRDLGENPIASDNGWPPGGRVNQHVDVYRLARLALPRAQPTARLTCSLDRLA